MKRFRLWTLAAGLLVVAPAPAQEERAQLEGEVVTEGILRIKIAVTGNPGHEASPHARELIQTVRGDLDFSGFFDVVDPSLYSLVPAANPGTVRHDDWISIGADKLATLQIKVAAERIDVTAWLYDNPSRSELLGQRYGGGIDLTRRIAHQISNDLMRQLIGRPGVALTRIAFVSKHGDGKELYLMDYDGQRLRRLTTTGTINLSPIWSPDAKRLAFTSWLGRQPGVYIMEADGTVNKAPVMNAELNAAPDWSPDGSKIVYSSDADGNSELYVLDLATGRNSRLTYTRAIETAPAYSPNNREIAFTSDRSGTPQIYIMGVDGLNVRRVSRDGSYNESPAWSPRGDKLAYVSRIDGRFDVVVLDLQTQELTRLTYGEGNNENPSWSPDGRHLVFSSNRKGTYDIYTMRADGSDVRRLTKNGNCFTAHWSR